jgi:predicted transposase/invertase (TIGR01784 family)
LTAQSKSTTARGSKAPELAEILPPKNDVVFRRLFADPENARLVQGFLEAVLDLPAGEYASITIRTPKSAPRRKNGKSAVVAIDIVTKSEKAVHVEVQVVNGDSSVRDRIAFRTPQLNSEELETITAYYFIPKAISILIADCRLLEENDEYFNRFRYYNRKNGVLLTDRLEIDVLESPKLPKENDNTLLWQWVKFFGSERKEDFDILEQTGAPVIREAVATLKAVSADKKLRRVYAARAESAKDASPR